jgi:hypothetical protein
MQEYELLKQEIKELQADVERNNSV